MTPHLELLRVPTTVGDAELRRRGLLRGCSARQRVGDYCEALVSRHYEGTLAPMNNPGHDLLCDVLGRVEVKARKRDSTHLNWFHVRGLDRRAFDHLVAVELRADWTVADAWLLSYAQVVEHRHKRGDGQLVEPTKLAVRGEWKEQVPRIDLAAAQAGLDVELRPRHHGTPATLDEDDFRFLRGLVRRKMRDQRNGSWALKKKIEESGGVYEAARQAASLDYVEAVYEKLGGSLDDVYNLRDRPSNERG
jgi:Family of unknown function (DUF6998)